MDPAERAAAAIRRVLAAGSAVFAVSAVALLVAPGLFAGALGLPDDIDGLGWALRMTGAALLGLAGQMWLVRRADDASVRGAAAVMILAGGAMTVLTLAIPAGWTLVRWAYLGVGLAFVVAYVALLRMGAGRR